MRGQKTGGRAAGTPNKNTAELRRTLKAIIASELESLPTALEQLPAKKRLEMVIKLMPFCLPKVDSIGSTYDADWSDLGGE